MAIRCFACWLTLGLVAVVAFSGCSSETKPAAVDASSDPVPSPPRGVPDQAPRTPPKVPPKAPGAEAATAVPPSGAPEAAADPAPKVVGQKVTGPKQGAKAPKRPAAPLAAEQP